MPLSGNLRESGQQPPYSRFIVKAAPRPGTGSTHDAVEARPEPNTGDFAMFVPRGKPLQLQVSDESGRLIFLANVCPAEDAAVVRLDPNVRTTAVALVGRVRPDLEAKADLEEKAARGPETLKPLRAAISKTLGLRSGEGVIASSDATAGSPSDTPTSIDASTEVSDSLQEVIPALEAQPPLPQEAPAQSSFQVAMQAYDEQGHLVASTVLPLPGGEPTTSPTSMNVQSVAAQDSMPPPPPPGPSPSPSPDEGSPFAPYPVPPHPIITPNPPGTQLSGPPPPLELGDGITLFRQHWDGVWSTIGASWTTLADAWYGSDWDLRACTPNCSTGSEGTHIIWLHALHPKPSFNTSAFATCYTGAVTVVNYFLDGENGTKIPYHDLTVTHSTPAGSSSVVLAARLRGWISTVRLTFFTRPPPGATPDRGTVNLGTWHFFGERVDDGVEQSLGLASVQKRDFDLKLVQDPDPYDPDTDPSPPVFRFVPVTYPEATSWRPIELHVSGTLGFRDPETQAVVAQVSLPETEGAVPPEGLVFLDNWAFTGSPVVVAAAPSIQADLPVPSPTPIGQLPDGRYLADFRQIVAYDMVARAAPRQGSGDGGKGGPVLELIDPAETRLLGSSDGNNKLWIDPVLVKEHLNPDMEGRPVSQERLQNRILLANTPDGNILHDRVLIRVRKLGSKADAISAVVKFRKTGEASVELRKDPTRNSTWSGEYGPAVVSPAGTTFTSADAISGSVQQEFVERMRASGKVQLGWVQSPMNAIGLETYFDSPTFDQRDWATAAFTNNIRAAGHDVAQLSIQLGAKKLAAYLRVKNQAQISQLFIHGDHATGGLSKTEDGNDQIMPLRDVRPSDWASVRTKILTSCAVLDINDLNQFFTSGPSLPGFSPGYKWDATMGGGSRQSCVVGYNAGMTVPIPLLGEFVRLGIHADNPDLTARNWIQANWNKRLYYPDVLLRQEFWKASAITSGPSGGGAYYYVLKTPRVVTRPERYGFSVVAAFDAKRLARPLWRQGTRWWQISRSFPVTSFTQILWQWHY